MPADVPVRLVPVRAREDAERAALRRIDGYLLHKFSADRKFHDFARLIGITVDHIIIAGEEVSVRCHRHSQRAMQVDIIRID